MNESFATGSINMSRFYWTALLIGCAFTAPAHAQLVVAHRGASFDAPENTLAAFQLAWEKGADAIEGDFYLSSDGHIVCIHDKTTERVSPTSPELTVAQTTLGELRQLDVGSWMHPRYADERIPLLKEVLATIPEGKRIFIEIKCGPEILAPLHETLLASTLHPEQVVIIAFSAEVVTQARRMMPQFKANWLTSYKQKSDDAPWKPTRQSVLETLADTNATGLGSQGNLNVLNANFLNAVRASGREIHIWTVNDANAARAFQELEVDSITTDRPAYIRNILNQRVTVGTD